MHKARVCSVGFGEIFAAWFILNYWSREFSLSAITNGFELRCQSRATHLICLQNLSLSIQNLVLELFIIAIVLGLHFSHVLFLVVLFLGRIGCLAAGELKVLEFEGDDDVSRVDHCTADNFFEILSDGRIRNFMGKFLTVKGKGLGKDLSES